MDQGNEDLRLARAVRAAVLAVPGVYAMGRGIYVEAATYGAGEKIVGVVVRPEEVRLHVVASYPSSRPVLAVAKNVREAVAPATRGRTVSVIVENLGPAPGELFGRAPIAGNALAGSSR